MKKIVAKIRERRDTGIMEKVPESVRSLGLEEKIGQMFLVGYPAGQEGVRILADSVRDCAFGNIILFSRNAGNPSFLFDHLRHIRSLILERTGIAPLVALDQEGGTVARVTAGVTRIPGAMAMAAAFAGGGADIADLERLGEISGTELHALGFNWNLAPVADVNVNPSNPVVGVRSFGEDPETVSELAAAYARGIARAGLAAAAKHFPGHGDTSVDSHLGLPLVEADLSRLEAVEFVPFRRLISDGIAAVMSAHVRFPSVEPDPVPATLSSRVLRGLLRERLGFRGLIVTDCLEMKAVADHFPDAAVRAVLAGADVLCISHCADVQRAAFASLLKAVSSGLIPESRIDESAARILDAKRRLPDPGSDRDRALSLLRSPEAVELSERISAASLSVLYGRRDSPLLPGGLYIDLEPDRLTGAEDVEGQAVTVAGALSAMDGRYRTLSLPVDPDGEASDAVLSRLDGAPVVMGVYAPGRHPGQAALVRKVASACRASGAELSFVSMRSPYDAAFLLEAAGGACRTIVCAWEYTPLSAVTVARYLAGGKRANGKCPVRVDVRAE